MDRLHRSILARLRETICQDLDVSNGIIDQLTTDYILKDEDLARISGGKSQTEKAEILLDILPNRGPHAFETFQQSLRHHYSWLSDQIENLLISNDTQANDGITRLPALPPISPLTVRREHKIDQLKTALRELNPGGYVVLHGMKGFGKSCLTMSTLSDHVMVKNLFHRQIYWIKFGYENPIEDEILNQLNMLYNLIRNDSSPSNNDHNCELLKDDIRKMLQQHFNSEPHRNSLLILDDVWDANIINTFDFNCKTLVITTNVDLLGDRHKQIVEIKNGFTEAESLGLFAKVLEVDVSKLPPQAKDIHYECNGMPILIAMFAAQFQEYKEQMRNTQDRWQYYLQALRKKDPKNQVIEKFLAKQEAIFDMCINLLPEEAHKRYRNLLIFSEDVNITPKTLEILWGEKSLLVDEQMLDLCHKSLAARYWNDELETYVYGVHDLLLCHLRKNLDKVQLSSMHRDFVEKYRDHCNNDFSKLPKDNYSFSYIGHHLEQAEMFDEFQNLYLDFNFICAKIYNSGINDLLIDLRKYRKYIINNNEEVEKKVDDIENFLKMQVKILAEHRRRKCLDLVQIGINHRLRGYLYETARKLAESQPKHLYLSHEKQYPIEEPHSEEVPIELCTVNFTDNPHQILIGSNYGDVILWDTKTRRQSPYSVVEKSKIIKVIVSKDGEFFVALTDQGVIKRFLLNYNDDEQSCDTEEISSPREKQSSWSGIYKCPKDTSITTYDLNEKCKANITDIALSSNDKKLAACTSEGTYRVWEITGEILCTADTNRNTTQKLSFAKQDSILFLVDADEGIVLYAATYFRTYGYKTIYRPMREIESGKIKHLNGTKVIYFNEITHESPKVIRMLLVTDLEAAIINWDIIENGDIAQPSTRFRVSIDVDLNPSTRFTAATLTYDDQYIVIADSEGLIKVWEVYGMFCEKASYPGKAICLDTYCHDDRDWYSIIGGLNQLTHRWLFKSEETAKCPTSVRVPMFDAIMRPINELDIVAQVMDKKIGVFQGDTLIAEVDVLEGEIMHLSLCQQVVPQILYIVTKGYRENFIYEIRLFNYLTKQDKLLSKIDNYTGLAKFLEINHSPVIVWQYKENLKSFMAPRITSDAPFTGNVINLHTIRNKYVVAIADNSKIIIWKIIDTAWLNVFELRGGMTNNVSYTALNSQENLLALLKTNGEMTIYNIEWNNIDGSNQITMEEYFKLNYFKKLTCCSFSPEGKFLAIGMENGAIRIFNVYLCTTSSELCLHSHSVLQLQWAPASIGVPILLSVNSEDIAWWNISLLPENKKLNRRSRTGLPRSSTTPTMGMSPRGSMRISKSQSTGDDISKLTLELEKISFGQSINNEDEEANQFWATKISKYENKPALLGVIQLPPSCKPKVCVSSDFTKFLLVDVHGSINTYKLFGF